MPGRLTQLTPDRLAALGEAGETARALYERIAGGPRRAMNITLADEAGALLGPFNAYLHTPELGARLERAGVALREETRLAPRLREIAILCSARHHRARFEWYAHARIARDVGVEAELIEAIRRGAAPDFADEKDAAVHRFCVELLETRRVGDPTYEALAARLDEREQVELVFVLGYYALVSMTLNVFEVPLPAGESPPFD